MTTAFKQVADNATSTTATLMLATGVTSIVVAAGDGTKFPLPGNGFFVTLWDSATYNTPGLDPNMEKVLCTARSTDTLTISATTKTHPNGCRVDLLDVSQNTTDLQVALNAVETGLALGPTSSRSYVYNNFASPMTVAANTYTNFLQIVDYIDTDGTPLFSYDTTNHRYNVLKTCMVQMYGDLFWNDISAEPTINLYLRWHGPTFPKSWVNFIRGFDYDILPKYGWRFQTPLLRFDAGDTFTLEIYKTGTANMTVNYAEVWGVAFAVS